MLKSVVVTFPYQTPHTAGNVGIYMIYLGDMHGNNSCMEGEYLR